MIQTVLATILCVLVVLAVVVPVGAATAPEVVRQDFARRWARIKQGPSRRNKERIAGVTLLAIMVLLAAGVLYVAAAPDHGWPLDWTVVGVIAVVLAGLSVPVAFWLSEWLPNTSSWDDDPFDGEVR